MADELTPEEEAHVQYLSPIASLKGAQGYQAFKESILEALAGKFTEFLDAPTERLQVIQGEASMLYTILGGPSDAASTKAGILARIEERREEAARIERRQLQQAQSNQHRRAAGSVPL